MTAPTYELLTDELGWGRVYFARGDRSPGARVNEVTDPPFPGYGQIFILDGEKSCTLFCPFTFQTFTVSHRSMEYASLRTASALPSAEQLATFIKAKWLEWASMSARVDFGMAAMILKKLGYEAPAITELAAIENDKPTRRKGKELEEQLKKPVKKNSKRGKFLAWFLADGAGPKSIQAAMAEFDMTRNNALSYLFMLNKDHGIGYVLSGNTATVMVPGNVDPYGE